MGDNLTSALLPSAYSWGGGDGAGAFGRMGPPLSSVLANAGVRGGAQPSMNDKPTLLLCSKLNVPETLHT